MGDGTAWGCVGLCRGVWGFVRVCGGSGMVWRGVGCVAASCPHFKGGSFLHHDFLSLFCPLVGVGLQTEPECSLHIKKAQTLMPGKHTPLLVSAAKRKKKYNKKQKNPGLLSIAMLF